MSSVLVIAHPGHELVVHHWLETERPVVYALTDGSGGNGRDRATRSRLIVEKTGSRVGGGFGLRSDRTWYAAILACDASPFFDAALTIANDMPADADVVACDAVEHFNPMHDLTAAVAERVARLAAHRWGHPVRTLSFSIEHVGAHRGEPQLELFLDAAAVDRKVAAANSYEELAEEIERVPEAKRVRHLAVEQFYLFDAETAFPPKLSEEPLYEVYGRRRIAAGLYRDLITYAEHVQPIARRILAN
jgi:hypothetical protein